MKSDHILAKYAVAEVSDPFRDYGTGYIAIGFIDQIEPRTTIDGPVALTRVEPYEGMGLKGSAIYVLSGSRRAAIKGLREAAKGKSLKPMPPNTLLQLPRENLLR